MRHLCARAGFVVVAALLLLCITVSTGMAQESAARVCVIVPHFKDEYWLSVGFGLQQAADETGTELRIYESGGYHSLARQIDLLETCRNGSSNAVLIGAVSADDPTLLAAVSEAAATQPVLALVNALTSPDLSGWVGVDWHGMGTAVGGFLTLRHPSGSAPARAVLITGPDQSGWGPILDGGLSAGLAGSSVTIVATYRADTGLREQLRQVERALADHPDVDYLIGSAPAIEGAMALYRRLPDGGHRPTLVATYISHSVLRGLKSGKVEMVPFDDPIAQGRLGLELALRSTRGQSFPGVSGPRITTVIAGTEQVRDIRLSPAGFFPVLE
ncbi:TMAO reductase system periplasmic protein TorT [Alisedimentitalea sp. MJ-SS2]|uniref:TMAO reductase system periplasmic protein TorT n=1 Tax=Aliisedimentitalea sp. MJ-SS2 TaxID=3049795 RepID=UPI0029137E8A|nr:TMAO reductase system periplasmic protein TorT [Alisedimentitalea sp. MJ-SS2]MDU8929343.1 TMAO reductase system periplasmic protein TorT [Alisedimentitalea sp. MJ-SS2]